MSNCWELRFCGVMNARGGRRIWKWCLGGFRLLDVMDDDYNVGGLAGV